MSSKEWFSEWFASPYYRILYQNRDQTEAENFIAHLYQYLLPQKGSKVVDIACGEGRHALEWHLKGMDVEAFDLSPLSIHKAKALEKDTLQFYLHDMRQIFRTQYFDYAFNLFTSFGYFKSAQDSLKAAKSFALCLKKGGTLVIDYFNVDWVLAQMKPQTTLYQGGIDFEIKKKFEKGYIIKDIAFKNENNKDCHFQERVAALKLSDFVTLFQSVGLKLKAHFGAYDLSPFNPITSPRLILVFEK